jgi:S1-C subfamily serine protease
LTPLRLLDSAGGLLLGAATGLALAWVVGATALLLPGQSELRRAVQRSAILSRINEDVPPRRLLNVLARIDPLPSFLGPAAPTEPPPTGIARDRDIRRAALGVVRVTGTACGLGVEGSGWFVARRLVATAAHVVAGERDTEIQLVGRPVPQRVDVVAFDSRNDVAVLRLRGGAGHPPLRVRKEPQEDRAVAILGYPENGPLTATPARIGRSATVITRTAAGSRLVPRTITAISGSVRHGDSGGPAVDADGFVQTMIFASRVGSSVGYGVPPALITRAVRSAHGPVSTGDCAAG